VNIIETRLLGMGVLLCGLIACAAPPPAVPERTPVRWIMVEKPVGEVVPNGQNGEGQVDPRSMIVTLQPLYSEDVNWEVVVDPHDFYVEIVAISPAGQAAPGETVCALVRVAHARSGDLYRLTAKGSQQDVQILGEREHLVRGGTPAAFRFTSLGPGRAGISVGVEKVANAP
jgi:hypothetical protein